MVAEAPVAIIKENCVWNLKLLKNAKKKSLTRTLKIIVTEYSDKYFNKITIEKWDLNVILLFAKKEKDVAAMKLEAFDTGIL